MQHLLRVLHLQMSLSHEVLEVFILGDTDETKERGQVVQGPYSKSSGFGQKKEVRWEEPVRLRQWVFRQGSSGSHRGEGRGQGTSEPAVAMALGTEWGTCPLT